MCDGGGERRFRKLYGNWEKGEIWFCVKWFLEVKLIWLGVKEKERGVVIIG